MSRRGFCVRKQHCNPLHNGAINVRVSLFCRHVPYSSFDLLRIRIQRLDEDLLILPARGKTGTISDQALVAVRIETNRYGDGVVCPRGFDVDTFPQDYLSIVFGVTVRPPNWIVSNPETGHAHVVYCLARPVLHDDGMRQKPLKWRQRIAMSREAPKSVGQSDSARFSFNRSGSGLQPDTAARTSPAAYRQGFASGLAT